MFAAARAAAPAVVFIDELDALAPARGGGAADGAGGVGAGVVAHHGCAKWVAMNRLLRVVVYYFPNTAVGAWNLGDSCGSHAIVLLLCRR